MKRLLACLLAVLLLAGCNLRNRQDSAGFVPPGGGSAVRPAGEQETVPGKPPADWGQPVKELSTDSGVYRYRGEEVSYQYRLPVVDLLSPYAALCNQIIDADYGADIRSAKSAMEKREPLVLRSVEYETWQHGTLMTLRIWKTAGDVITGQDFFCFDVETGEEAGVDALRQAAGIGDSDWLRLLEQAVSDFYRETFGSYYDSEDLLYSEGLRRSTEAGNLEKARPRYLTREGRLAATVTIFDPSGAVNTVWVPVG